jgi:serine protease Do
MTVLAFRAPGFAQQKEMDDSAAGKQHGYDEIVIKRKSDKDVKVTVEIKDGQVLVNGKPVTEFDDDNISVRKKKFRVMDDHDFDFSGLANLDELKALSSEAPEPPEADMDIVPPMPPEPPVSRFRNHSGVWNLEGNSNQAFLGVTSVNTGSESENKGQKGAGAQIKEISKGSAAEKAGLKVGDLITHIDEIAVDGPGSLFEAVHKYKPQDKITITIKRDGKEQKVAVVLGKSKSVAETYNFQYKMPDLNNLGFDFERGLKGPGAYNYNYNFGLGGMDKPRLGIKAQDTEDGKGVKVLEVDDESAANKAGIKEGDIITRFDGKEVNSAPSLVEGARAAKDKPSIHVSLLRDGKPQEIDVKIPRKLKTANL